MFAIVFDSVSGGEWLVLLAVILIVVGPKNLPSAARKIGEIMSKLRRAADEFKRQLMTMDEEMKKTADEIKKEYIDIPEDGADRAVADVSDDSDDPYGYNYDDPDYPGEYPDGYPDDYDGGDDDSGPSMGESGDVAATGEPSGADAPSSSEAAVAENTVSSVPETPEKSNG